LNKNFGKVTKNFSKIFKPKETMISIKKDLSQKNLKIKKPLKFKKKKNKKKNAK
jgi:hypothetical protein